MRKLIWVPVLAMALLLAGCSTPATPAAPAAATEVATEAATEAPTEAMTEAATETAATETTGGATVELPAVDPLAVTGDIITAGSSTVFPLSEAISEQFIDEGYAGNLTIDSIGTGAGFERFCKTGESDISNASRPIKDSERENCTAINRTPIEFRVRDRCTCRSRESTKRLDPGRRSDYCAAGPDILQGHHELVGH